MAFTTISQICKLHPFPDNLEHFDLHRKIVYLEVNPICPCVSKHECLEIELCGFVLLSSQVVEFQCCSEHLLQMLIISESLIPHKMWPSSSRESFVKVILCEMLIWSTGNWKPHISPSWFGAIPPVPFPQFPSTQFSLTWLQALEINPWQ